MTAIDYERVALGMKAHIMSKRSHGQDELLQTFTRLEVESQLPEGQDAFDERPPRRTQHDPPGEPVLAGRRAATA